MEVKLNIPTLLVKRLFWPIWGVISAVKALVDSFFGDKRLIYDIIFGACLLFSVIFSMLTLFSLLACHFNDSFWYFNRNIGMAWPYENYIMNWGRWIITLIAVIMSAGLAKYISETR